MFPSLPFELGLKSPMKNLVYLFLRMHEGFLSNLVLVTTLQGKSCGYATLMQAWVMRLGKNSCMKDTVFYVTAIDVLRRLEALRPEKLRGEGMP